MSFKAGVFTSAATCTHADRELETRLNAKLTAGRAILWTQPDTQEYGLTYSYNGLSKAFMRRTFDLDVDDVAKGLMQTMQTMQNARLRPGWTYDENEVDQLPNWLVYE